MDPMLALIERLRGNGVEIDARVEAALIEVDVRQFSDDDPTPFFHDRPLVFLETVNGGVKTISAPHMVAQLVHHLELSTGQTVLIVGCKGGYMAALISELVGPEGEVVVIDPSDEVVEHAVDRLHQRSGCTVSRIEAIDIAPEGVPGSLSRVLITGSIRSPPPWLEDRLEEGGFIIAPLGGPMHQRLIKRERQGEELLDTDLGDVVFGPVDISDSEPGLPGPQDLADMMEEASVLLKDHFNVEGEMLERLSDLICRLRDMPADLPPPDLTKHLDDDGEEEVDDKHPVVKALEDEADWLPGLWPIIALLMDVRLANPGAPAEEFEESDDQSDGHEDFIP